MNVTQCNEHQNLNETKSEFVFRFRKSFERVPGESVKFVVENAEPIKFALCLKGLFTIFLFSVRTHILDSNEVWIATLLQKNTIIFAVEKIF